MIREVLEQRVWPPLQICKTSPLFISQLTVEVVERGRELAAAAANLAAQAAVPMRNL
jgi:hypothetical protein